MRIASILKPGLFVYECIRIIVLAFTLVYQSFDAVSWLAFTAPGVLFPLMTLFLCLDFNRFKAYLPLYIAGKCVGIFTLLSWFIFSGHITMIEGIAGFYVIAELVFLSGDLFALAAVLLLARKMDTEEKQCE